QKAASSLTLQQCPAVQRAMQQGAANDNWFEPEAA
ncbi:hypothetical protein ACU2P5_005207, partial [Escherichia coli]